MEQYQRKRAMLLVWSFYLVQFGRSLTRLGWSFFVLSQLCWLTPPTSRVPVRTILDWLKKGRLVSPVCRQFACMHDRREPEHKPITGESTDRAQSLARLSTPSFWLQLSVLYWSLHWKVIARAKNTATRRVEPPTLIHVIPRGGFMNIQQHSEISDRVC